MDLWIRSQKKRNLIRVNEIYLDDVYFDDGSICIMGNKFILGKYKEKRAMEIIDEISNLLKPQIKTIHNKVWQKEDLITGGIEMVINPVIEDIKVQELSTCFYQMPEE